MNKKNYVVAAGLGFAQLALLTGSAIAQERSASQLDEVVLVASRSPKKQSEIGKAVKVIGPEMLAKSQGRTLYELLNTVAGLTISGAGNAPGSAVTVFTRGAARGNTLILIDGIPAANASDLNNEFDISSIAINQVERIEILKGTNSTLYGSDAVAGVINIITRQPSAGKPRADIMATGGSYGTFKEAASLNGMIGTTGLALNISNSTSDGFSAAKDPSGAANFDLDGFTQRSLSGHLTHAFSSHLSIKANLQLNRNTFDTDDGAFADDRDYTVKNSIFNGGIRARYQYPSGAVELIYNQNNVRNQFNDPETNGDFSRQDNKGRIYYAEAIVNQQVAQWVDLTAGINYRNMETDQEYESQSSFGPYNSHLTYGDANSQVAGAYSSFFLKAGGFHAELGGRFNMGGHFGNDRQYGNSFTYTINPSYSVNGHKIYLNVASAFKAPSLYQLTSEYKNKSGELVPERTSSVEGGVSLTLVPSALNLDLSGFIRNTNNLIYFYTDLTTFASEYRNGYKQHDYGVEAELAATPLADLTFSLWFAYVKGKGTDVSGTTVDYLLRRPKNTWGAAGSYRFSQAVSLDLSYKYTGARLDPFGYPAVNLIQHPYSLFDAYLQVKPSAKVTLFADAKNLFDEGYTEWEGFTARGRNFNAGFKYIF
jgi:vitamin B12 transporter